MSTDIDRNAASYIRITAVSIAAYDYIMTLPAEWRFYKGQRSGRLSAGCILFILIRYLSIVVLTVSTIGYFGRFSSHFCSRYYVVGPTFKVLQTMVSQIILGIRTINISRRSRWVTSILFFMFAVVTAGEWFTNFYHREYVQNAHYNCSDGEDVHHLSAWLYYVMAIIYDFTALVISTYYLLRYSVHPGRLARLIKLMLYDGIGFFVVLTAVNILNLVLFHTSDELTQSSASSLGEAVTWIMSQRLLIHLQDAAEKHQRATHIISRPVRSARTIPHVVRAQFEDDKTCSRYADDAAGDCQWSPFDDPPHSLTDLVHQLSDVELDVQVQIEHSVTVEYDADPEACACELECEACQPGPPRIAWTPQGSRSKVDVESGL